jgi:hypothetical protein
MFNKNALIQEIKESIIEELGSDAKFKADLKEALDIKEDVIIIKGDAQLEVKKK